MFREARNNQTLQEQYIRLLRGLFKSSGQTDKMIEAAYMTGILPIKKCGTLSAMTDFKEYTMLMPEPLEEYVGFAEKEVRELCDNSGLDFSIVRQWYDGYILGDNTHVYSPKSVIDALARNRIGNYWTQSETYESLKVYIDLDEDGLKEAVAPAIEAVHRAGTAPVYYNNEQALRSTIRFAYISCIDEFMKVEELASGIGYADIVYIPKKASALPILLIELKWDKTEEGAIKQIKEKCYPQVFEGYSGDILMVGINYNVKNKKHTCKIEKFSR